MIRYVIFKNADFKKHRIDDDFVDMGFNSGTKWAKRNLGASSETDYGAYFAFGNSKTQESYDYKSAPFYISGGVANADYSKYNSTDNRTQLFPSDDAAHVYYGENIYIPSKDQFEELISTSHSTLVEKEINGILGCEIISQINGNSIFMPYGGYKDDSENPKSIGTDGNWWSNTVDSTHTTAYTLGLNTTKRNGINSKYRYFGYSIRPVRL